MGDLSKNFSSYEFECPCCGRSKMNSYTITLLQRVRDEYGKSIKIIEGGGYRCRNYAESPHSAHRDGKAVDLGIPKKDIYPVLVLALKYGFLGIGVKNKDNRWQLHLDTASHINGLRPRPWVWTY